MVKEPLRMLRTQLDLDKQRVAVEPDRPAAFGDRRSVWVSRRDVNDEHAVLGAGRGKGVKTDRAD